MAQSGVSVCGNVHPPLAKTDAPESRQREEARGRLRQYRVEHIRQRDDRNYVAESSRTGSLFYYTDTKRSTSKTTESLKVIALELDGAFICLDSMRK